MNQAREVLATRAFFEEYIKLCRKHGMMLAPASGVDGVASFHDPMRVITYGHPSTEHFLGRTLAEPDDFRRGN